MVYLYYTYYYVDRVVLLGVTLDANLQWGPQITKLLKQLGSAHNILATARWGYFSNFHSLMAYGICFGLLLPTLRIFVIQKCAVWAFYKRPFFH